MKNCFSKVSVELALMSVLIFMGGCGMAIDPTIPIDSETLANWSAPYRNWHYWPELVVSASPDDGLNFKSVDCPFSGIGITVVEFLFLEC